MTDAVDHTVPLISIDRTLIVDVDMILQTTGIISHILDPAHRIIGVVVISHTHLMTVIPLILTIEGTVIGQFLGACHQRQGFLIDIIPGVILLGLGEEH